MTAIGVVPGTVATLAGVELDNETDLSWRLTQGYEAYQRIFTVTRETAGRILQATSGGSECSLRVATPGLPVAQFDGLTVLGGAPASKPWLQGIVVTDRRWRWNRVHVLRRFNIPRRSGEKRAVGAANIERAAIADDLRYAAFSMYQQKEPWTAIQAVEDVLREVTLGAYVMDPELSSQALQQLPVEGFEIDDSGDVAAARVCLLVPDLVLYMDERGITHAGLRNSGSERTQVSVLPPVIGPTLYEDVSFARSRPSQVSVYFTVEDEIRLDYHDPATGTASGVTALREPQLISGQVLQNVMPLPDPTLTINGVLHTVGEWVEINDALLSAMNAAHPCTIRGKSGSITKTIDLAFVRRFWMAGGYLAMFEFESSGDPVWMRRWQALKTHYRQTFRLDRRWMDRLLSIRGHRVAVADAETRTRSRSPVYTNCLMIPTSRAIFTDTFDATGALGRHFRGYNASLGNAKVAPTASVQMLDEEQGIFHVRFSPEAWGNSMDVLPSDGEGRDGGELPFANVSPAAIQAGFKWRDIKLAEDHDLATLVTAAPASPNSVRQLYRVDVSPTEAKTVLPQTVADRIGECSGPPWQIRIGAGICTARFGWLDAYRDEVQDAIARDGVRSEERLVNSDQITAVARGAAAAVYSMMADRLEGGHTTWLDPARRPTGRITDVIHELRRGGSALTTLELSADFKPIDIMAMVPESIRRKVLGLVQD